MVSTIHLKHIVNMAPRELWGDEFNTMVDTFQPEHAMIQFHYATTEAPKYPLAGGGTISSTEAVLMDRAESVLASRIRIMRAAKFGWKTRRFKS